MPTVLKHHGFRFFFFSNEGDEPPYIHVQSAEKYAKFWIDPILLERSVGFNPSELSNLRRIVEQHSGEFKRKWNEYFNR